MGLNSSGWVTSTCLWFSFLGELTRVQKHVSVSALPACVQFLPWPGNALAAEQMTRLKGIQVHFPFPGLQCQHLMNLPGLLQATRTQAPPKPSLLSACAKGFGLHSNLLLRELPRTLSKADCITSVMGTLQAWPMLTVGQGLGLLF